jgi:Ser-tRNA(Ala) deacylase AlaX
LTELLWLQEPARRTCLARVTAVRGQGFLLDRSLFCPGSPSPYRHPQPADRGEVWLGGDKRWLARVAWHRGELLHFLDGAVPKRGDQVRCHLDAQRRGACEDAHTAMHLVLSALVRARAGAVLTDEGRVQGGRHFALAVRQDTFEPKAIAEALARANEAAARPLEVTLEHATRDALHGVDPQPFVDREAFPGDAATLRIVRIGDASALPCDGTLRTTTQGLGRVVLAAARPDARGMALQFRVEA